MEDTPGLLPQTQTAEFPFSEDIQNRILCRYARDRSFHLKFSSTLEPKNFQSAYRQLIALCLGTHFAEFKKLPDPQYLLNRLQVFCEKDTRLTIEGFYPLLQYVYNTHIEDKDEYLESETEKFLKKRTFLRALTEARALVDESEDFEKARRLVARAGGGFSGFEIRIEHRSSASERITNLSTKERKCVPTIVSPELDRAIEGGTGQGELMTIIAPTGRGKTLVMANFAKGAIMKGMKALYVTLETSAEIISQRVDSSFLSMSKAQIKQNPDRAIALIESNYQRFGGQLMVVQYPANSISCSNLEYLLDDLSVRDGFVPDVLFVDYADLLKAGSSRSDRRFELSEIYTDLRAIGTVYQIPVITASQSNRGSFNEETVGLQHIAEDIGKAQISDIIISLCQTREEFEKAPKEMRLYIAKNRNGPNGFAIPVNVNPETMQIYPRQIVAGVTPTTETKAVSVPAPETKPRRKYEVKVDPAPGQLPPAIDAQMVSLLEKFRNRDIEREARRKEAEASGKPITYAPV